MNYQEFKPSKKLLSLVDCYWFLTDVTKSEKEKIIPDGCADIIFNTGNSSSSIPKESIVISGMMTTFLPVSLEKGSELLGVRFKAGQMSRLTRHPLSVLKNKTLTASDFIPECKTDKLELLNQQHTLQEKLEFVEHLLCNLIHKQNLPVDKLIFSVTDFILKSSNPVVVTKLAERYAISLRQLERRFQDKVGVSVKEYASIIRFKQSIKSIAHKPEESILQIALDHGYYDHSHFTNECKRFSGQVPSFFR